MSHDLVITAFTHLSILCRARQGMLCLTMHTLCGNHCFFSIPFIGGIFDNPLTDCANKRH